MEEAMLDESAVVLSSDRRSVANGKHRRALSAVV